MKFINNSCPKLFEIPKIALARHFFIVCFVQATNSKDLKQLLSKYLAIFDKKLGQVLRTQARLYIDPGAKSKYYKWWLVSYMLKKRIQPEFESLQEKGTIWPVAFSRWTAHILPILKPDKTIWISEDYKETVNTVIKLVKYSIPKTSLPLLEEADLKTS